MRRIVSVGHSGIKQKFRVLKEKEFKSVTDLSARLGRDKVGVTRDLKHPEEFGLVRLEKEGAYLPLAEPKPVPQV